jgi:hypothetical protein
MKSLEIVLTPAYFTAMLAVFAILFICASIGWVVNKLKTYNYV